MKILILGGPIELAIIGDNGAKKYGRRLKRAIERATKSELEAIIQENTGNGK